MDGSVAPFVRIAGADVYTDPGLQLPNRSKGKNAVLDFQLSQFLFLFT